MTAYSPSHPLDLSDYSPGDDLAHAATMPSRWYTDPAFLELEKPKIFWKTWQPVGRLDQVLRPGDYFTADVVGERLVVTRGLDDELRAFFNVCQHRAGPVAVGKGNRKTLQCKYHGWTYDLNGRLMNAPEFNGVENWHKEEVCLMSIKVEAWGPFIFVNLDPDAVPMGEIYGDIDTEIKRKGFKIAAMRAFERRDYVIDCNWKVYVDNYLEGYHVPIAHPGLYRELDYEQYRVDTFRYYSSQYAPIRPAKLGDVQGRDRRYVRSETEAEALYYWIFPNVMLNIYPDNMSINIILPLSHDRTLTIFEWYFEEPGTGEGWESIQQTIAFSDEIQQEDIEICVAVQQGLASRAYDTGRFSVKRENGVHHFQTLVHEFLTAP
jgi:choline monooxygenase